MEYITLCTVQSKFFCGEKNTLIA